MLIFFCNILDQNLQNLTLTKPCVQKLAGILAQAGLAGPGRRVDRGTAVRLLRRRGERAVKAVVLTATSCRVRQKMHTTRLAASLGLGQRS
jgi:hypothetical protein